MSVASQLRRVLESEVAWGGGAAVFHPDLQAMPIASMGGGMGIVATAGIPPGATLARMPFCSMITVKKGRLNLALAEVALERGRGVFRDGVVPFLSSSWTEEQWATALTPQTAKATTEALREKLSTLRQELSGTETIAAYLVLLAALYGRWESGGGGTGAAGAEETRPAMRFSHENAWMGTWIRCLPSQYDNLLELGICGGRPSEAGGSEADAPGKAADVSRLGAVDAALAFPRHRAKVLQEQAHAWQRYRHCVSVLRCLQCLPRGELVATGAEGNTTTSQEERQRWEEQAAEGATVSGSRGVCCSMKQFLWAFNSLMSRGFAFPDEVWAMLPYVDYFNYALDSNGTMFTQRKNTPAASSPPSSRKKLTLRSQSREASACPFSVGGDCVYCFKTTRPVEAGKQIVLHYGAYSDFELLLWYGFTLSTALLPPEPLPVRGEDEAGENRTPLSMVIGQLQSERLRQGLFLRHKARFTDCISACDDGGPQDGEGVGGESFAMWQTALQRAYSCVFTPLADTDGVYPAPLDGDNTWVDDLVSAFLLSSREGPVFGGAEGALHAWGLFFARDWSQNAAGRAKLMAVKGLTAADASGSVCAALGVLAPSWLMLGTIRFLASYGVWGAFTKEGCDSVSERVAVLRALAWMELVAAQQAVPPDSAFVREAAEEEGEEERVARSPVVSMARTLTSQVKALLRFLSVEATDAELRLYLTREPEY